MYSDTPTPKFSDQPHVVFSTPGLGHITQDYVLYVPIRTYETNVKEVEKQLDTVAKGGYDHDLPLIAPPLAKKKKKMQKGFGKKNEADKDLEDALAHPIQVVLLFQFSLLLTSFSLFFFFLDWRG